MLEKKTQNIKIGKKLYLLPDGNIFNNAKFII